MTIYEKPARQMKWPFNNNLLVEPYLNKKIFLQYSLLILIACHSHVQVNVPSSIFNSGWGNHNNEVIHGLHHSRASLLPATISFGCTCNKNLGLRAGHIAGREGRGKASRLKRISS